MEALVEITCCEYIIWLVLFYIMKNKPNIGFFLTPVITTVLFVVLPANDYEETIYYIAMIMLYFLVPLFLTSGIKKTAVLYTTLITTAIFYFIYNFIFLIMDFFAIPYEDLAYVFTIILSTAGIIVFFRNKDINNIAKLISTKTKIVLLIYIWIVFALFTELKFFLSGIHKDIGYILIFFMYMTILGTAAVIFLLIKNTFKSWYYKKLSLTMEIKLQEQVKYYEQLNQANNELRKFHHNYKNMKIGLMALLKNNDVTGAEKYIADCDSTITGNIMLYQTGSPVVDAMLSDKARKTKDENIVILFNGMIPQAVISSTDLCIVFGNILDNAIEACEKIDSKNSKEINITIQQKKEYLFVSVTNPTDSKVNINNNKIITSKEDKYHHGLGLVSVEETLKKYDGHLDLCWANNLFAANFDLCIH